MLLIPCGVFFDDYPMFSPGELAEDADRSASELMDLLGWKHARTGPKGRPFEPCFQVLGCTLNLERAAAGEIVLENKQGRLERIYHHLDSFREEGKMSLHKSQILFLRENICSKFAWKFFVWGNTDRFRPMGA